MLIDDFFSILELKQTQKSEEGTYILDVTIKINSQHRIFQGHFPDMPVVPGVCLIEIIREILEKHFKKQLFIKGLKNTKFTSIVNPLVNDLLNVSYELTELEDKSLNVKSKIFYKDTIFLKFDGLFSTQYE